MEALLKEKMDTLQYSHLKSLPDGPSWLATGHVDEINYESISTVVDQLVEKAITDYSLMEMLYSKGKVNKYRRGQCKIAMRATAFEHNHGIGMIFALVDKSKVEQGYSMLEQYRKWR